MINIYKVITIILLCTACIGCKSAYLSVSDKVVIIPKGVIVPIYTANGKDTIDYKTPMDLYAEGAGNWADKQKKLNECALLQAK